MESSTYHLLRLIRRRPIGGSPLLGKHIRVCPAALRAVGRLVGRQVGASVFVFAYAVTGRVSLRSLSTPSQARETRLRCLRSYAEAG